MYIESPKAVLMPVVHQAPAVQKAGAQPHNTETIAASTRGAPQSAPLDADEAINQSALQAIENRKRVAVVEKAMGMNKALIVEKDAQRVGFTYKTIDTSTGEVTRVWPQREVATALIALADVDARSIMQGIMVDALA